MSLEYNKKLIPRAKELRSNATPHEDKLWYQFLRYYPIRFQRQKVIGAFIADFYCHRAHLVIELDGSQHFTPEGIAYDEARTAALETYQLHVLRFTNREVDDEFDAVCRKIDHDVSSHLTTDHD